MLARAKDAIEPEDRATVEPDAPSGPPVNPVPVAIEIDCKAVAANTSAAYAAEDKSTVNVPADVIGPPPTTTPVPGVEIPTLVTVPPAPLPLDAAVI